MTGLQNISPSKTFQSSTKPWGQLNTNLNLILDNNCHCSDLLELGPCFRQRIRQHLQIYTDILKNSSIYNMELTK